MSGLMVATWTGAPSWLLFVFALLVAWQIQRPVREMAAAAGMLSRQQPVAPLRERGPLELRQLIERFNRMVADLARIDQERNTMLAGIAHDLKTPLARPQALLPCALKPWALKPWA